MIIAFWQCHTRGLHEGMARGALGGNDEMMMVVVMMRMMMIQ
jgi:hypothetical protein